MAAHSWSDKPAPAEATSDWHDEARKRDEAYLALGPIDMTETTNGPWSGGIDPDPLRPMNDTVADDDTAEDF